MDRRTFLGAAGAVAGTSIAGCLNPADGDEGDVAGSSTDATGSYDVGAYSRVLEWAPPIDGGDEPPFGYGTYTRSVSQFLELDDDLEIDVETRLRAAATFDWGRIDPAELELDVQVSSGETSSLPSYRVLVGPFDKAPLRDGLAEIGKRDGSHEGYDLYVGTVYDSLEEELRDGRAMGVGEDGVILVGEYDDTRATTDHVRRIVDAVTESTDRIVDQDEAVGTIASLIEPGATSLLSRVDPDRETRVSTGTFAGTEAVGVSGSFVGDTMETSEFYLFESAGAVETDAFDEYVSQQVADGTTDTSDYSVDGRIVTVTSTTSIESIFQL